ncbi:hypothetical protein AVEN_26380-1 [Araneus ventricosus]|uniref:Uncharacterized protein n=1 Tax=Araneus ventricosus TaxID=182803 RepID=A0A4Y2QTA3_ARAVE|nr:hypothetical protein AVEN_26380-1 [Araneus ventricosus]
MRQCSSSMWQVNESKALRGWKNIICKFWFDLFQLCSTINLVFLVMLTSRFEATRGLFWDGLCNFEPRSDDEDDTRAGTPSTNFHATPMGGRLATKDDLACSGPHTRRIFSGIGFRAWSPLAPRLRPYH